MKSYLLGAASTAIITAALISCTEVEAAGGYSPPVEVFGSEADEFQIYFFVERGDCQAGQAVAGHLNRATKILTPGCYFKAYDYYWIKFSDGDIGAIGKEFVKPLPAVRGKSVDL